MDDDRRNEDQTQQQQAGRQMDQRQDSGLPGGGVGRREEPGHTGVYPMSSPEDASPDAPLQDENAWGQGERGDAGYADSGDSETFHVPAESEEGEHDEEQA